MWSSWAVESLEYGSHCKYCYPVSAQKHLLDHWFFRTALLFLQKTGGITIMWRQTGVWRRRSTKEEGYKSLLNNGLQKANGRIRTDNHWFTKPELYRWATLATFFISSYFAILYSKNNLIARKSRANNNKAVSLKETALLFSTFSAACPLCTFRLYDLLHYFTSWDL